MKLVGIHRLLAASPIWLTVLVIWIFGPGAIYILRDWLEGLGYQISYTAEFGDIALMVGWILIPATILQRFKKEEWFHYPLFQLLYSDVAQILLYGICLMIGYIFDITTLASRSGQVGDIYHDLFIVPFFLFTGIAVLPVVWPNARRYEKAAIVLATLVWISFACFDAWAGRMNQLEWLGHHGFAIHGEIPRQ